MQKILIKLKNTYNTNKKYLPSKDFLKFFGLIVGVLLIIFLTSYLFKYKNTKQAVNIKEKTETKTENQTVLELLQNDTDSDGVFDWEETLWGTNKYKPATFDGTLDIKYIENKKSELKITDSVDEKTLTETDKFAREFFSAYTAMQGNGQINDQTMRNFASSLGQKIVHPELPDKYSADDIKTTKVDDLDRQENYYTTVSEIFTKYEAKGIGEELAIISNGLEEYQQKSQPNSFSELIKISEAYKNFANDVINTQVPETLAKYHLKMVNGAYNTGVSISNMAKVINDPLIGVSGVSEYEKYSNEFTDAVAELEASFEE